MPSDTPPPKPDFHIAAFEAVAERRRDMLRELTELETAVAQALAKAEQAAADARIRRELSRGFDQPLAGGGARFFVRGAERPTCH